MNPTLKVWPQLLAILVAVFPVGPISLRVMPHR